MSRWASIWVIVVFSQASIPRRLVRSSSATILYQEALEEGKEQAKLEAIPRMLQFGLSQDAIAQILDLPLEVVQQVATQQNTSGQSPFSN